MKRVPYKKDQNNPQVKEYVTAMKKGKPTNTTVEEILERMKKHTPRGIQEEGFDQLLDISEGNYNQAIDDVISKLTSLESAIREDERKKNIEAVRNLLDEFNDIPEDVEKRFNEKFTYGGITGVVALNPKRFNEDDPRPFKQFIAQELSLAVKAERERIASLIDFGMEDVCVNGKMVSNAEDLIKALTQESK